jgi:hypothetical protein
LPINIYLLVITLPFLGLALICRKNSIKNSAIEISKVLGWIGFVGIIVLATLGYSGNKYWQNNIFLLIIILPFLCLASIRDINTFLIKRFLIKLFLFCSYLAFLYFTNFTNEKKLYALYTQITPNMRIEEFEDLKEYYFHNDKVNKVLKTEVIKDSRYKETGNIGIFYWIRENYKRNKAGRLISTGDALILTVNKGEIIKAYYPGL